MKSANDQKILAFYLALYRAWGRQHWWPARGRFEVIVGAYLTQNTSWTNVENALRRLRNARRLSLRGIRMTPLPELERLIRSAGYFRQKARRLKLFVAWLDRRHDGSLTRMFKQPTPQLREELLTLNGIGPETADSILLYAGQHPIFVVDAYTRRIFERHDILPANTTYGEIRALVERSLADIPIDSSVEPGSGFGAHSGRGASHPPSRMSLAKRTQLAQVYNDMHGLIVGVGKHHCWKSQPNCDGCPLQGFLPVVR